MTFQHAFRLIRASALLILLASSFPGCGGGGSGAGAGSSYQGPGSHYLVALDDDGTFHIEISDDPASAADTIVDGTYTRLATGFLDMNVTSASGVDAPSPGAQAIALEVPGFALLLKPLDSNGEIIPMIEAGECPSSDFVANWFQTSCRDGGVDCDAADVNRGFLGEFQYLVSTDQADVTFEHNLVSGAGIPTGSILSATCADGIMEAGTARVYLTSSGGAIVYTNPADDANSNHIVAIAQEALTPGDLAGNYAGLVFEGDAASTLTVNATLDAGGLTGTIYDVDEAALAVAANGVQLATLAFSSSNDISGSGAPGWMTGTLDNGVEPIRPLYCTADVDVAGTTRDLVLCVGQSPGDASAHYNLVLVSREPV